MVGERQQHLPVVEVGHRVVDLVDPDELGVDLEPDQHVHDRLGEVVVQREQPRRHVRRDYAAMGRGLSASWSSRSIASSMTGGATDGYSW
jgi:hypothetical protein